jgi:phospholipase/carboxylesterase
MWLLPREDWGVHENAAPVERLNLSGEVERWSGVGTFGAPTVVTRGDAGPEAPLVVLLHGRGSHEREIIGLVDVLPEGPVYAAVRAPIAEEGGYAWFANPGDRATSTGVAEVDHGLVPGPARRGRPGRAPGRPHRVQRWRRVRVRRRAAPRRARPLRRRGPPRRHAALRRRGPRHPRTAGREPVFVAQGDDDAAIPRELLDRT